MTLVSGMGGLILSRLIISSFNHGVSQEIWLVANTANAKKRSLMWLDVSNLTSGLNNQVFVDTAIYLKIYHFVFATKPGLFCYVFTTFFFP